MKYPRWALGAVLAIVAGAVMVGASPPAPAAEAPRVLMVDNEPDLTRWHYEPADITVPAGTTVVWFNKGKHEHSVTADDKSFDSGLKGTGGTFSRAFARPGKYTYYCAPHPWMKGSVEVVAGAAAPTQRTAAAAPPATAATTAPAAPTPTPTATSSPGATTPATGGPTTTTAAAAPASESVAQDETEDTEDAAADSDTRSGGPLAGTLAVVLLPTLGALALGAKLRQSRS